MPDSFDEIPQEFWDVVDEFINFANSLSDKWGSSRVSSTILFAAARYNAFHFFDTTSDPKKYQSDAVEFFCKEYREMLLENIDWLKAQKLTDEKR